MDTQSRIDRINNERLRQSLSYQQFADMSGVSQSTAHRTLTGKTIPDGATIDAMEEALGITDNPAGEPIQFLAESNPILERYLNTQEARINRMRAHYNMLLAEKNRWIMMLFILSLILVIFICGILVFDVLHPDIGWIRQQLGLGYSKFKEFLNATGDLISYFCLNIV